MAERRSLLALFTLLACAPLAAGCAEAVEPVHTAADTRPRAEKLPLPTEENFWHASAWSASMERPLERPRSISLGYIGDGPLPGGITRDDPMPPREPPNPYGPQSWQQYVNTPSWPSAARPAYDGRGGGYASPHAGRGPYPSQTPGPGGQPGGCSCAYGPPPPPYLSRPPAAARPTCAAGLCDSLPSAMAKPILVTYRGAESSFDHVKLEREELHGKRVRMPTDRGGGRCERVMLTEEGDLLLSHGMTGQGYFDAAGSWVPITELMGLDPRGEPLPFVPSTLGVAQKLEKAPPEAVLDLQLASIHSLTPERVSPSLAKELEAGAIFRFPFNYGSDYHAETAFLLKNEHGTFCLVGVPLVHRWSELGRVPALEAVDDAEGDLDFEMF